MKVTISLDGKVDCSWEFQKNDKTQTGGFKADLKMEQPITYEITVEDHEALIQVYKDFGYERFMEALIQAIPEMMDPLKNMGPTGNA